MTAKTCLHGLRLKGRTTDGIAKDLFRRGSMDDAQIAMLRDLVLFRPGDVVFDIGANIGWYSLVFDRSAPDGVDIFAFEPDPLNFELLTHNIGLNRATRVHPQRLGVADRNGTRTLHRFENSNLGHHSMLPLHQGESIEVDTVSLDSFWDGQGLGDRTPRLIKIDIEGFELAALQGGRGVLARCPLVLMEYSPGFMRTAGLQPIELVSEMQALGFRAYESGPEGLIERDLDDLPYSTGHMDLFWRRS